MFSALGILALTLGFVVLFLTFMWIANLRHKARGPVGEMEDKPEQSGTAIMIHGANYGLVLGILACALFKVSTLMLVISLAGIYYASRALWQGMSWYRIIVYRALVGLILGVASVGLHLLNVSGQLPAISQ